MPISYRGKFLVGKTLFWSVGECVIVLLAYCIFDSLENGDWRKLFLVFDLFILLSFLFLFFFTKESYRFLLFNNREEEGLIILKDIIEEINPNKMYYIEDENYKKKLLNWINSKKLKVKRTIRIKELLND